MFPRDFLTHIAAEYELSPEQAEAFVELFSRNDGNQLEAAERLHITSNAFRTRMTGVYNKFNFRDKRPGKFHRLEKFLRGKYQKISGSSVGGDTLDPADIDALVQQARDKVSADIQKRCGWMRVLDMNQPIAVNAIYTDVNILEKITGKTRRDLNELMQGCTAETFDRFLLGQVREERVDGLDTVRKKRQLMILGRPGAGKTTFLKRLATVCNLGKFLPEQAPIFVSLKEFAETEQQPGLISFITERYFSPELTGAMVDSILRQGRGLLLLDGLDEVLECHHDRVLREMREFAQHYERSYLVVACRIAAREYVFEQFTEVEVADFSDQQIQDFADKWFKVKEPDQVDEQGHSTIAQLFWQALEECKPIKELAKNPLLLTLLCLEFEESSEFPRSRAELYERGLNVLLRKWDGQRRIKRDEVYKRLSIHRKESLLGQLAMQTFERGEYFFKQQTAERLIGQYIENLPDASTDPDALLVDSQAVLKAIESQHGLLTERATGIYSFSHLTFHEYFTAKNILDTTEPTAQITALEKLVSHVAETRWQEIFLLVAERMDSADYLLTQTKQRVDHLIVANAPIQQFLVWVHQKSQSIENLYKPAAIRALYFALGLYLSRTLALALALAFDLSLYLNRNFDLDHVLNLDLGLYLTLDRALDLDLNRARARDLDITRALDRILDITLGHDHELKQSLQDLKNQLPSPRKDWNQFKQWWKANGTDWTEQLEAVMIQHCNIGHKWQFTEDQQELLQQYYNANRLLVKCLNSECYVSRGVRQQIEESLLLPMSYQP